MSSFEREKEKLQGPVTTEGTTLNSPPTVNHTVIWNGCVCQHLHQQMSFPGCTTPAIRDVRRTNHNVLQESARAACRHLLFLYVCVDITDELQGRVLTLMQMTCGI